MCIRDRFRSVHIRSSEWGHIPSADDRQTSIEWGKSHLCVAGWMVFGVRINTFVQGISCLGVYRRNLPSGGISHQSVERGKSHLRGAWMDARRNRLRVGEIPLRGVVVVISAKCKAWIVFYSRKCNTKERIWKGVHCLHESLTVNRSSCTDQ